MSQWIRFFFQGIALSLLLAGASHADSLSTAGNILLLHDEPGNNGGKVTGGAYSVDTSTGSAIGGVVSIVTSGIQAKDGYTGQLYDPVSLELTADPETTVSEGDSVQLAALLMLDDSTRLSPKETEWTVVSGPAQLHPNGLAVAASVIENESATIKAKLGGLEDTIQLDVVNMAYEPTPISWSAPPAGSTPPYQIWFGTKPSSLSRIATTSSTSFNPGPLTPGSTYYFQVFDSENNDITPGGPGPQSLRTPRYRADLRIGARLKPSTHMGNGKYSRTGKGQTLKVGLVGRKTSRTFFSVQNDGDRVDHERTRAPKGKRKMKFVKYFRLTRGRTNITGTIIRAGYVQKEINPGGVIVYLIQSKSRGTSRAHQTLTISARSARDTRLVDQGRARLKSARTTPSK